MNLFYFGAWLNPQPKNIMMPKLCDYRNQKG